MLLFGSSAAAYVTWVTGTAVGAIWGGELGDPQDLGLDAIFPAFFLGLLLNETRSGRARGVAAPAALIALVLVPVAPAGVPVLVASLAALVGLTRGAREAVLRAPGGGGGAAVSTGATVIIGCALVDRSPSRPRGPLRWAGASCRLWFTSVVDPAVAGPARRARGDPGARGRRPASRLGADTAGVAAGGLMIWRTGSIIACVLIAPAVTAVLRAL